jgi:Zn finger protein HypA/HybF involved in hydrogenase expression
MVVCGRNLLIEESGMQAYCMKCRKKVEIKNPKSITTKNKQPATRGECPSCGTSVYNMASLRLGGEAKG